MDFLQVTKCCGFVDLKIGSLIFSYIMFVANIVFLPFDDSIWFKLINILSSLTMIYGIHFKHSRWMIPNLISVALHTFLLLTSIIFIPICRLFFWQQTQIDIIILLNRMRLDVINIDSSLLILWCALSVSALIMWHITSVLFSTYKEFKNIENRSNLILNNSNYNTNL